MSWRTLRNLKKFCFILLQLNKEKLVNCSGVRTSNCQHVVFGSTPWNSSDIQRKTFRPQGRQWCNKTINGSEDCRKWAFLFTSQRVIFKVRNKGAACDPQHASFPKHSEETSCHSNKAYSRCHCKPLSGNISERRIVPLVPLLVNCNFMCFHLTTFKLQKLASTCCASGGAWWQCTYLA